MEECYSWLAFLHPKPLWKSVFDLFPLMKGTKLPQGNMKRLTIIDSVQNKVCADQQHLLLDQLIQCQGMSYFEHFTEGGYSFGLLHLHPVDLDILQQNCPKAQTPSQRQFYLPDFIFFCFTLLHCHAEFSRYILTGNLGWCPCGLWKESLDNI